MPAIAQAGKQILRGHAKRTGVWHVCADEDPLVQEQQGNRATAPGTGKQERWLALLFLLSLPLLNPWVHGDGVGYYAFARAPLIEHSLDFQHDYQYANSSFRDARLGQNGVPKATFRTVTGHLDNHFAVGPAILWAPFLVVAHVAVLLAHAFGSSVAADGFSAPYRIAMALGTALYGFLGVVLAGRIVGQYVEGRWVTLAAISVWWASSLPVYMYFNPSWSHAHSAFAVALFLWYWHQTRRDRSIGQWIVLGAITGLMLNVYYANAMVLAVLFVEAMGQYRAASRGGVPNLTAVQLLYRHALFAAIVVVCLLPTLITRAIIYGNPLESGYIPLGAWAWSSPYFLQVLFSANHGLLVWTPLLAFSVAGLFLFWKRQPVVGSAFVAALLAFYVLIACYPDWAGISSYGNRFFVSLTALFIIGLAVLLDRVATLFRSARGATMAACTALLCFLLWNMAFMFQWGTHLVPARGPISWSEMVHNQFVVVPHEISAKIGSYLFHRANLMRQIEQRDMEQMKEPSEP
jgi:hypothetical protein